MSPPPGRTGLPLIGTCCPLMLGTEQWSMTQGNYGMWSDKIYWAATLLSTCYTHIFPFFIIWLWVFTDHMANPVRFGIITKTTNGAIVWLSSLVNVPGVLVQVFKNLSTLVTCWEVTIFSLLCLFFLLHGPVHSSMPLDGPVYSFQCLLLSFQLLSVQLSGRPYF